MRWIAAGLLSVALAIACQPGEPIELKTPVNSRIPKVERTDDPVATPRSPADAG